MKIGVNCYHVNKNVHKSGRKSDDNLDASLKNCHRKLNEGEE